MSKYLESGSVCVAFSDATALVTLAGSGQGGGAVVGGSVTGGSVTGGSVGWIAGAGAVVSNWLVSGVTSLGGVVSVGSSDAEESDVESPTENSGSVVLSV